MSRFLISIAALFAAAMACATPVTACDSCGCSLARCVLKEGAGTQNQWFFDTSFEDLNWDARPARDAHQLHHEGHHVHDKTHEEFYRFTLGYEPAKRWLVLVEIPYVFRHALEIDDHARLGQKEVSEGVGDLKVFATWHWLENADGYWGPAAGVKFPTGSTTERNSAGARFEPEMQPGSGSYDYISGLVFGRNAGPVRWSGNALYTIRTEGDQAFEFGDAFSSYILADVPIWEAPRALTVRAGGDASLSVESRQKEGGVAMTDSGGVTLLLGPAMTLDGASGWSLFANVLFPVWQDLAGVHQQLDFAFNASAKVAW